MQASEEPMAEAPTVLAASGAFHKSAIMCTHRASISAVCGYSSLSIMFLLTDSAISPRTSGSTHVWQNVARFWRALPSSISSSDTSWNASLGSVPSSGNRYLCTGLVRSRSANTQSSNWSRTVSRSCNGIFGASFDPVTRFGIPRPGAAVRPEAAPPCWPAMTRDVVTRWGWRVGKGAGPGDAFGWYQAAGAEEDFPGLKPASAEKTD
jgi:hypothetical protein